MYTVVLRLTREHARHDTTATLKPLSPWSAICIDEILSRSQNGKKPIPCNNYYYEQHEKTFGHDCEMKGTINFQLARFRPNTIILKMTTSVIKQTYSMKGSSSKKNF